MEMQACEVSPLSPEKRLGGLRFQRARADPAPRFGNSGSPRIVARRTSSSVDYEAVFEDQESASDDDESVKTPGIQTAS
jgi:hypothetical protein